MKHIVGLGNPGTKYATNRHNAGHLFVDLLNNLNIAGVKAVKTDGFMNVSGVFAQKYVNAHGVKIDDLYVAHDDLDIPLGLFKIQLACGPKIHNGVSSVENELGTDEFWRIRIGVDARPAGRPRTMSGEEYVLSDFTPEELIQLAEVFDRIATRLKTM
jgi:PTH1 family peptidyl-tRNA hydrolase